MNRGGRTRYTRGGYNNRYNSRGRGRGGSGRGNARSSAPRGVFADGIWHCDCTPRLPAEHFKVKKESKNQGRWFYTCQNQEPQRCGFFLWDEDAKLREEGAVLNNSRSEPKPKQVSATQDGWDAGRSKNSMFAAVDPMNKAIDNSTLQGDDESTDNEYAAPERQSTGAVKRKASDADLDGGDDDDDDQLLSWSLTGQEEQDLISAADSAVPPPETPRKAAKTGVYATPATTDKNRKLPWLEGSIDPSTESASSYIQSLHSANHDDTPSKQPTKSLPSISEQAYGPTPTLHFDTPSTLVGGPQPQGRHRDALADPADSASSLTSEALAALSGTSVAPDVIAKLRGVLSKHDLKTQGVVKGRDISRLALKAKEAKIVELQARIASLEAEREVDRSVIRNLRWEGQTGAHGVVGEE